MGHDRGTDREDAWMSQGWDMTDIRLIYVNMNI